MKMMHCLLLAALTALSGCGDGIVRPPPTNVRFFDAAPNFEAMAFLREEHAEASLQYSGAGRVSFDSGEYDFHLESTRGGSVTAVRELTFNETLSPERDYTFIAVSPGGEPQVLVASNESYPSDATAPRLTIVDANPGLGPVDVYVVAPGTAPGAAGSRGSLSFGPDVLSVELTAATYHIILTAAGDPQTVLYESVDFDATERMDAVIVIADPGGKIQSDLALYAVTNESQAIHQLGLEPRVRAVQAVDDRQNRDIVLDDATTALFSALPFGEISAYAPLSSAAHSVRLTPVGTPGTVEASVSFSPLPGRLFTGVFAGDTTDGIFGLLVPEDLRRLTDTAVLRIVNAAGLFGTIDVFIQAPGTDITTVAPTVALNAPNTTNRLAFAPGDREITFVDHATSAILAGPITLSLAGDGIYGILLVNSADSSTVDIKYLYDLAP